MRRWGKVIPLVLLLAAWGPAGPGGAQFVPSVHGFRFANHFTGWPGPVSFGAIGGGGADERTYGLCGGMSLAAADFFLASRPIPSTAVAPGQDDPLYKYLYRRQVDSLGPGLCFAPVFARWMALPDDGADGTFARTAANMDSITGALEQDRPVMLGLVLQRSGEPGALLWQNHQVLALGPARVLAGEHWPNSVVGIYDPNFPGNDGVILELRAVEVGVMSLPRPLHGEFPLYGIRTTRISGSRRTPVRGVFELPYVRRTPPSDLK